MKTKSIITAVLLLFVVASVAALVGKEMVRRNQLAAIEKGAGATPAVAAPETGAVQGRKVVAYYFHGTARCASCQKIEDYTAETLLTQFPDAVSNGKLEWRVVNVDEPQNEHFVKDFALYSKQVVLVELENGQQKRWKDLDKVWDFLSDKITFQSYVKGEVDGFLGES